MIFSFRHRSAAGQIKSPQAAKKLVASGCIRNARFHPELSLHLGDMSIARDTRMVPAPTFRAAFSPWRRLSVQKGTETDVFRYLILTHRIGVVKYRRKNINKNRVSRLDFGMFPWYHEKKRRIPKGEQI